MTHKTACALFFGVVICGCGSDMAPETTPPWSVSDLTVRGAPDGYHLRWTARGDDGNTGRASQYDVRYFAGDLVANWSAAQSAPSPPKPSNPGHPDSMTVSGIGEGPFQFGIKTADELGNWSAISNVVIASVDVTPPAAISDLSVRSTFQGFYLRWTAPTDNGMEHKAARYEIRYAESNLAGSWDSSPIAPNALVPAAAGHADSTVVAGIGMGPWEIAVRSADASGNWSALSNVVATTIPDDAVSPAPVTDLSVDMVTEGSVVLRWTASGDDGTSGQASAYDIRYAEAPVTPDTWAAANRAPSPSPRASGEGELFAVPSLQSGTTYYIALRVLDESENSSGISNLVSASVSSPTQLTHNAEWAGAPDWSPDGQKIVFDARWSISTYSVPELYVIPASGGTATRYTSFSAGANVASWSPDGNKFAFALLIEEEGYTREAIAVMDAVSEADYQILADPWVKVAWPSRWSPDGTKIAYVASVWSPGEAPTSQVFTIPSTGGAPELLYDGWAVWGLDWSPDGTQIVYSSNEGGTQDLWLMSSAGGTGTRLTDGSGTERLPAWAPDGSKIAYEGNGQIWVLYLAETELTQVTFDPDRKVSGKMAWSPDGSAIAFQAITADEGNLWILRTR